MCLRGQVNFVRSVEQKGISDILIQGIKYFSNQLRRIILMKQLVCEMCGGTDLVKQDGMFVCQTCGTKYSVEEAKKMMIEGTVDVQGTVQIDNTSFVQRYLANARRAKTKEDWQETEKYYNMVEQNDPRNIEAIFYSAYGKVRHALTTDNFNARQEAINVFTKSISIIDDNFDLSTWEDNFPIIDQMVDDVIKLRNVPMAFTSKTNMSVNRINNSTNKTQLRTSMITMKGSLNNILSSIPEEEKNKRNKIALLIDKLSKAIEEKKSGGCYVATAVYGSYDCPQVWILRRYRDNTLAKTWYGRSFIRTYYTISPTLVKLFGHTAWFKKMWRGKLDRMVKSLKEKGVSDTPYEDRPW